MHLTVPLTLFDFAKTFIKLECTNESVVDEQAAESEVMGIYESQQNYLELIRNHTPTPPLLEFQSWCGEVETNIYDEPIKELIIVPESKESTPEYETVPVKTLINTYEQGKSLHFIFDAAIVFGSPTQCINRNRNFS